MHSTHMEAEMEATKQQANATQKDYDELRAENARLREALETIAQSEHPDAPLLGDGTEAGECHGIVELARAALGGR